MPEPLEVTALAIPGDKNSGLLVTDLPLNSPNKLAPDSCDATSANHRQVLRVELVLLNGLWEPLDVALRLDIFVE